MSVANQAAGTSSSGFRRQLGLFDATMIVAGSMIGSGIFIVSADIARDVGSSGWLLLVWALTGLMTIIGALSYAELAGMMPAAGGQYIYLREAYGPLWAFLFGWTSFLIIQTGFIAAVSVAFAKYLGVLFPALGTGEEAFLWDTGVKLRLVVPVPWLDQPLVFLDRGLTIHRGQLVAIGVAVVLTMLNCLGVREGKWVQNIFTVAKAAGLVVLIIVGLTVALSPAAIEMNLQDPWRGITVTPQFNQVSKFTPWTSWAIMLVLCGAMVGSLFSSDAWGNVTFAAAEVRDPHRNLPRCLILGVGLVITLYLLANVAYLAALPARGTPELHAQVRAQEQRIAALQREGKIDEAKAAKKQLDEYLSNADTFARGIAHAKDDRVATAVMERVSPRFGVAFMAIAIMVSTFGCVNGIVLSAARLNYAMARDGLFFQSVGRLNQRGVPAAGLVYQLIWSIVLIFSGSYSELLDYVIFAALLFYVLTIGALYVLRRKRPDLPRPYRAFGFPVVPAIYVAQCSVIMLALLVVKPTYSWPSFIIILSGIPIYWLWRGRRNSAG